ncbi:MAG: hypothetical protein JO348_08355 [Alphaproteobacteria bacterium]|nr:hypothetical protein [Alphaproteobacteria bacterium]MBV9419770.1 hypothetical protein [Alphaproteobacteria bacterium]
MMKNIVAATLSAALLIPAVASAQEHAALAPGKPAGTHEALLRAPVWVWIAGIGFIALGIALASSGGSNNSAGSTTGTGVL